MTPGTDLTFELDTGDQISEITENHGSGTRGWLDPTCIPSTLEKLGPPWSQLTKPYNLIGSAWHICSRSGGTRTRDQGIMRRSQSVRAGGQFARVRLIFASH